jgi:uncharacterized membrane protein HdeD (DUF308 family)
MTTGPREEIKVPPSHAQDPDTGDPQIRQSRFWWISIVRGILSLLLGTAVLFTQDNRAMLANFIGAYWLLSGLLTLRWAVTVRWLRGSQIGLAAGSLSVIAALLVLLRVQLQDVIAPNTLINVLGAAAVLTGSLRLLGAFEIERRTGRRWTFGGLALGSVEVVLGLVLIGTNGENERVVSIVFAAWGLVGGCLLLMEGFRLRHQARHVRDGGDTGLVQDRRQG